MKDTIIIGGGPAGMTAAIYLKRFGKNVTVIMKDCGALGKTDVVENYYGFNTIGGCELVKNGMEQAKKLGVEIIEDEVINLSYDGDYLVKTANKEYQAKTVLLATGSNRSKLRVKGFEDYVGKGISFCAICDGFFYKNKKLAIIGNGKYMEEELNVLKEYTKDILVFTNETSLEVEVDYPVIKSKITELQGNVKLEKIITKDGEYDIDGIFVAMGTASASDFATKMGAEVSNNKIVVNTNHETNIPGLYAAGDCIGGILQISKAISDGTAASLAINKYLKNLT
ncbi:MAG TPA: NAD(P)/FAD-dependent oxidoreductase [Acholeplasmataceae bacterium]|nr:NAD(P)/FAD-dependent oxidoreductase [Acholeplasmataceae bacterium]